MRKLVHVFIAVVISLFAARAARAQGLIIQQYANGSAITCVPLSSNTLPVPWVQTHGKVQHNATSLQDIVLFCPIDFSTVTYPTSVQGTFVDPPTVFTVKYVDPDAAKTQANVLAELKYADAAGNMVELAVASSNTLSNGSTGITTMDADIGKFTSSGGQLFVQLTLHRTTTGLLPAVYGFSLH